MQEPHRHRPRILVWSWSLDIGAAALTDAAALLSADETARSRQFVSSRLRARFVAGRARLRSLLGEHIGSDPRTLVFAQNAFGKPSLAQAPAVHFNLSHSGDRAILALSEELALGVDVECVRDVDHLDLARRYFHPNEVLAIESAEPRDAQLLAFFRTWTLKEAIVKAIGEGLSVPLDSFEVSIATAPPSLASGLHDSPRPWWLHSARGPGAYCWALAAPGAADVELIQRTS